MTITIDLPKTTEVKLRKKAESKGQKVDEFVLGLVERELLPSWRELVRPIHERTKELGMSEEDVEEFVDELVAEVRRERPLWKR